MVEDGYGILPDVAEYWKHNAALLKFGIMRGVGDAEIAYKEDLSWVSHNMQLPETGFHGTEEDQMRERVFHWTLLVFEDPLARNYLASQYKYGNGMCVPHNPALGEFWGAYKALLDLPDEIRLRILSEVNFYPFKYQEDFPKNPEAWSGVFPTKSFFNE